jgi:2-polyprenyl-6-methoxyphenol hydroxylase-like FAD-dependent oxidoreductase
VTRLEERLPAATQVLISGGGPVGLAAGIELRRRGIDCLVVEPRATVSHARPRCKTINVRSMEHLRRWGIAERLRDRAPLPVSWSQDIVFCTSLVGRELSRFTGAFGLTAEGDRFPELGQQAPQYVLEELLREVLDELHPRSLMTGIRVAGLEQDAHEVRVAVTDEAGDRAVVSAEYVLGCDGPRSAVREAIGSAYVGESALRPNFGMVFRAPDLLARARHGPAVQYWVVNTTSPALMGPIDLQGTWWMIAFDVDRDTGRRDARKLIDACAGVPTQASIVSDDPWTARMQLVDVARRGRVFLAGDAAHLNPPFGGHGLNTGLGDGVDLGWKLAAVLDGWGGPRLLDSYEAERRPVQTSVIAAAAANNRVLATDLLADGIDAEGEAGMRARRLVHDRIQATKDAEFHSLDLVLDVAYENSPIIAAGEGARLEHAWLGAGRSVYGELGQGMTLLVLGEDRAGEAHAIARAAAARRVPLQIADLAAHRLRDRYGADLVLVRPDQHVAWRTDHSSERADHSLDDPVNLIDRLRGAVPATAR